MSILKYLNRAYFIAVLFVFALGFAGCSESDNDVTGGDVAISLTRPTVAATEIAQFLDITCDGSWNIIIEYPAGEAWCTVASSSGRGNSKTALQYSKNTSEDERKAIIRLTSGSGDATATLTQLGVSGGETPPESGLANWLELPAQNQESNGRYITHYTTIKGKQVRNFTMFFDTNEKLAYWVAYPHCEMYLGSVGRTDAFRPDPSFANNQQMTSTISGYDRGHQIPSGDRTATKEMNAQTFYYSNMTPQLGGFNQRIWVDLETKVRTWTSGCDTLYVVTGAVLKTVGGNETVKRVQDKSGNSIAVPNYYFKVLLQLKLNGGNNRSYKAIGFWFNHQANSGSVSAANAVSVDDVERRTGFDFFTNLPEEIQNQLESKFAPQEWGL